MIPAGMVDVDETNTPFNQATRHQAVSRKILERLTSATFPAAKVLRRKPIEPVILVGLARLVRDIGQLGQRRLKPIG